MSFAFIKSRLCAHTNTTTTTTHITTTHTNMSVLPLPWPPRDTTLTSDTIRQYSMLRPQYERCGQRFRTQVSPSPSSSSASSSASIHCTLDVVPLPCTRADEDDDFDETMAINPYPILARVLTTPERERQVKNYRAGHRHARPRPWPVAAARLDTPPAWPCKRPNPPTRSFHSGPNH